jgi:hypothetical protein
MDTRNEFGNLDFGVSASLSHQEASIEYRRPWHPLFAASDKGIFHPYCELLNDPNPRPLWPPQGDVKTLLG